MSEVTMRSLILALIENLEDPFPNKGAAQNQAEALLWMLDNAHRTSVSVGSYDDAMTIAGRLIPD